MHLWISCSCEEALQERKKRVELLATDDSRHVAFLHEKEENRRRICGWQERDGRKLCENYYEEEE
jgi:hypothetical protein